MVLVADTAVRAQHIWQQMLKQYEPLPLDHAIAEALHDFVAHREQELAGMNLYD